MTDIFVPENVADLLPFRDEGYQNNPYPYFKRLRDEFPALQLSDKAFVISRYQDVNELLRSPAMSAKEVDLGLFGLLHHSVLNMDPPEHTRHRRLINKLLTPKMNTVWVETMRRCVEQTLDGIGDAGELEAVDALAIRPLHATTCDILGIPFERTAEVRSLSYVFSMSLGPGATEEEAQRGAEALEGLAQYSQELLARARKNPAGGMLDEWVAAEARGEVTEQEIIANLALFQSVGHFSAATPIANGLERLARDPELAQVFRDDAGSRPRIINELIRIDTPEHFVVRVALDELTVAGTVIPKGSTLYLLLSAANRDENVFPEPDTFDYERPVEASQHLAFAAGPHACMGQNLVRRQSELVLSLVTERYSKIELAGEPEYGNTDFARNWKTLPLRLSS